MIMATRKEKKADVLYEPGMVLDDEKNNDSDYEEEVEEEYEEDDGDEYEDEDDDDEPDTDEIEEEEEEEEESKRKQEEDVEVVGESLRPRLRSLAKKTLSSKMSIRDDEKKAAKTGKVAELELTTTPIATASTSIFKPKITKLSADPGEDKMQKTTSEVVTKKKFTKVIRVCYICVRRK